MKRKFAAVLATGMFTVASLCGVGIARTSTSVSIQELSAQAQDYCSPCSCSSDCHSSATGNIYPGYNKESF